MAKDLEETVEVCVMQSADTVLEVLRDRGRRKLPLERLYRQLFNEQLFLVAYERIYANDGAMTPGADGKTPDGMSLETIREIIDRLRAERYRFTPVRRVYIPKKNGSPAASAEVVYDRPGDGRVVR
jgi:retron-type reverse transcriptase